MTDAALKDPELIDALADDEDGEGLATGQPEGADQGEGDRQPAEDDDPPEVKAIAKRFGWKEDFQGDPAKRVSAGQFIDNTRQVIFNQRDKLARLEPLVDRLATETNRLRTSQQERDAASLERQLEAAVEAGDLEGAKKIMASAKASATSEPAASPAVTDFKVRNAAWFGVDPDATEYAASVDRRLTKEAGGIANISDQAVHAAMIEAAVKKRFPEHFGGEAGKSDPKPEERRQAPLINKGNRAVGKPGSADITEADLTGVERKAAAAFGVTPKEYAEQLNEDRKKAAAR